MNTPPWLRRSAILLIALAVVAALVMWFGRTKPIPVVVAEITKGKVEATVANTRAGTVEACQRTRLSTIAGGRIEVLAVKEGDRVEKGQLLMKLWNDDQQAQQALAQAQLETARRRVGEACTMADAAEREAQAPDRAARAGLRLDRARRQRARRGRRARAPAAPPRTPTCARPRRASTSRGSSRAARVLVAPFDGTVAKIVGEVGEYSTPSPPGVPTPPAIDLIDDSCLYVKAPLDEVDAPRVQRRPAGAHLDRRAAAAQTFPGRVQARRALRLGAREAGAHGRHRGRRSTQPARSGRCSSATAPTSRSSSACATTCCACRPRRSATGGRVLVVDGDTLVERTREDRPRELGVRRGAAKASPPANASSPRSSAQA